MSDLQQQVNAILRKFVRDPAIAIDASASLDDIGIDALDLPVVFLDLEEAVGVSMTYEDEIEGFDTIGHLTARVAMRQEEMRIRTLAPRTIKAKRGWMSTGPDSR